MRALVEQQPRRGHALRVVAVLSDKAAAAGLESARDLGIPSQAIVPAPGRRARRVRPGAGRGRSTACTPRSSCSRASCAFYPRRSSAHYAGRILNIHPSLLPKYPGLHTHRRVLEAHETEHGATVHFVTEELDGGSGGHPGARCGEPDDDEASLAARVQAQEHRIYPLAVRWFCEGRLRCEAGQAWLDGKALSAPVQLRRNNHDC